MRSIRMPKVCPNCLERMMVEVWLGRRIPYRATEKCPRCDHECSWPVTWVELVKER
jgi:hypothetical protein